MNAARDTRTYGQRRSDGRSFGPAQAARRRRNRDFRPVRRINASVALGWAAAMGFTLLLASPPFRPVWLAVWGWTP